MLFRHLRSMVAFYSLWLTLFLQEAVRPTQAARPIQAARPTQGSLPLAKRAIKDFRQLGQFTASNFGKENLHQSK